MVGIQFDLIFNLTAVKLQCLLIVFLCLTLTCFVRTLITHISLSTLLFVVRTLITHTTLLTFATTVLSRAVALAYTRYHLHVTHPLVSAHRPSFMSFVQLTTALAILQHTTHTLNTSSPMSHPPTHTHTFQHFGCVPLIWRVGWGMGEVGEFGHDMGSARWLAPCSSIARYNFNDNKKTTQRKTSVFEMQFWRSSKSP